MTVRERLLAALVTLAALAGPGYAVPDTDSLELADADSVYVERYLDNPKVSGNLLVGLRWASRSGNDAHMPFDPANVRLLPPDTHAPQKACVEIASKDGRYAAQNLYAVPPNVAHAPRLTVKTRYESQLTSYMLDDVAVLIRATIACDSASFGKLIPALPLRRDAPVPANVATESGVLLADVNADPDRLALSLALDGVVVATGRCTTAAEGVRIAFSAVCSLAPEQPLAAGEYILQLAVRERFKTVAKPFHILIAK
jgi:hypothetical protein